jgi:hypothetical protein
MLRRVAIPSGETRIDHLRMPPVHDVARIRLGNALLLFDEFVHVQFKHQDAAALRGLERHFAERLQIQASYWSQIKSRSRQIGERLARQFEHLCHKPRGWMDEPQDMVATPSAPAESAPRTDDERFIVGLVLSCYRRHPERARARMRLRDLGQRPMMATRFGNGHAAVLHRSKRKR